MRCGWVHTPFISVFIDEYKSNIKSIRKYADLDSRERLFYWLLELEYRDYFDRVERIKELIMEDLYLYQSDFDLIKFVRTCKEININYKPYVCYYNKLEELYE